LIRARLCYAPPSLAFLRDHRDIGRRRVDGRQPEAIMRLVKLRLIAATAVVLAVASVLCAQGEKVDLTGKWTFDVQTDAGSGTPTVTLKQDGDKLSGHYSGQLGEAELTGTVTGADFTFAFASEIQGTQLNVVYKGTIVSKDSLKGTLSISGLGNGTFTAKRQ